MAGTFVSDTIQNGAGATVPTTTVISGSAKAWVNFNGLSGSVAIRSSFNVSSITYNTTGDYTINFTTAMPNTNYCTTLGMRNNSDGLGLTASVFGDNTTQGGTLTTSVRCRWFANGFGAADNSTCNVVIFGS
jgi:hypothetical protein